MVVLIIYHTRCGTWLGDKVPGVRLRNAVKTFAEAMNGSYKDSSAGKRDCQGFQTVQSLRTSLFVHMCILSATVRLTNTSVRGWLKLSK